jgi:hypothetical protein
VEDHWRSCTHLQQTESIITKTITWKQFQFFFIIKPTDALISQIYSGTKLYMFRAVPLPVIRSYALYIRHWHMLYGFEDSLRAGWGWNRSLIPILHASCRQTCIACAGAECTVDNSWWWAEELPETCKVSYQNKFGKISASVGFIIKKFVTMHSHMKLKVPVLFTKRFMLQTGGWRRSPGVYYTIFIKAATRSSRASRI